ncbi:MAG: hypothetical protein IPG53_11975 [Ignavibacteriales bacterium]|nr:hypothetical protein [Ignavibacteriales bacterium]
MIFVDANVGWVFAKVLQVHWQTLSTKPLMVGATWTAQSHGISAASAGQVYGASMLDANKGMLVTWDPMPYSTIDGGTTWRRDTTIDNFSGFLYDIKQVDDSLGYMVGSSGKNI